MWKKASAVAGLAALTLSSTAWAGGQGTFPVVINTTNNTLEGSFGSARHSSDPLQSLDVGFMVGNGYYYAFIFAFDATGTMGACTTTNRDMIEILKAASPDSYIKVYHDGRGTCLDVEMRKASYLEPK
ncbi:hypothetical protein [Corallococcus sp. EGB]|uniref:hypothetical protein n=1 Tax=Corallococcus sp. EGB TaxID=1521117 RepID=UPI001CBD0997|nr:hypothetical protein [Corallococcus sp. EGB]